jgi:hypothetical protein
LERLASSLGGDESDATGMFRIKRDAASSDKGVT